MDFPNFELNMLVPDYPVIDRIMYFTLDDGRIWSVAEAEFVGAVPEGEVSGTCPDKEGKGTLEGLLDTLRWNKYPLGELATDEDLAAEAREKRNRLIAETDYLAMPDYPLSEARRQALAAYRQALRDIPEQAGFPRQIDWPVKP